MVETLTKYGKFLRATGKCTVDRREAYTSQDDHG